MSEASVPSTFETMSVLTLKTLPDASALLRTSVALVVVRLTVALFPKTDVAAMMFGAAMMWTP
jgi:hypothetical protein